MFLHFQENFFHRIIIIIIPLYIEVMVSQDSFQTTRKILNYFVKLHKCFGSVNIESGQEDKKFALIRKLNEIFPY